MADDVKDEDELKPSFRIRFTISNTNSHSSSSRSPCNDRRSDLSLRLDSELHNCHHQVEQSDIECHLPSCESNSRKKLFEFIQPQNHKSSLFVNLGGGQQRNENQSFISPDLNRFTPASPVEATPSSDSPLANVKPKEYNHKIFCEENFEISSDSDSTMSQGCNFLGWASATRRRSSSVTPQAPSNNHLYPTPASTNGRRASSSNDITDQPTNLNDRSHSGDHLAINVSNETICGGEATQTNKTLIDDDYVHLQPDNKMRSLQIDIEESNRGAPQKYSGGSYPISLDDILQIDLDSMRLEDECKNLENQIQFWEQKVDKLERRRFGDDVSRTLVENVIKQRKRLRELECQIFKLNLELEESAEQKLSPASNDLSNYLSHPRGIASPQLYKIQDNQSHRMDEYTSANCKLSTGKFGSHLRPGQENTVDILDAVPPSGSLQYTQYLSRATGTDTSEYAQLPSYEHHKHQLPQPNQSMISSDDSMSGNEFMQRRREHSLTRHQSRRQEHYHYQQQQQQHQKQVYVQLENCNDHEVRHHAPQRPTHFETDFKPTHAIVSQDSSSTASSSSPH